MYYIHNNIFASYIIRFVSLSICLKIIVYLFSHVFTIIFSKFIKKKKELLGINLLSH